MTNNGRIPTHAGPEEQALPVILQFEHLCPLCLQGFGDQTTGFGQNLAQIIMRQGKIAEIGQHALAPEQHLNGVAVRHDQAHSEGVPPAAARLTHRPAN